MSAEPRRSKVRVYKTYGVCVLTWWDVLVLVLKAGVIRVPQAYVSQSTSSIHPPIFSRAGAGTNRKNFQWAPRPAVLLERAPNFKDGRQLFLRVLQLAVATTPLPVLPRPYIIGFPTASTASTASIPSSPPAGPLNRP